MPGVGQGFGLVTSIHDVDRTIMWQGQQNAKLAGDSSYFTIPGYALEARWRKQFFSGAAPPRPGATPPNRRKPGE